MKAVISDIDGVLNHRSWYAGLAGTPTPPPGWVDPACLARLNALCASTDAVLVLSSGWRRHLPNDKAPMTAAEALAAAGLRTPVYGITPVFDATLEPPADNRWREIEAWLLDHPEVTSYVILEDCEAWTAYFPVDRYVLTSLDTGLTDEHLREALAILEG